MRGRSTVAALVLVLAGCGGDAATPGAEMPAVASNGWAKGDRAVVLPAGNEEHITAYTPLESQPGELEAWRIEKGTEVIVLGDGHKPGFSQIHVPAEAIYDAYIQEVPEQGVDVSISEENLYRPR